MSWRHDISIKRKVMFVILLTSMVVLTLVCTTALLYERSAARQAMVEDANALADVLGQNSTVALSLPGNQSRAVQKTLATLAVEPHVISACVYREGTDERFAEYVRSGASADFPAHRPADGYSFDATSLTLARPISLGNDRLGTLLLRLDLGRLQERLQTLVIIVMCVAAAAFLVALFLSSRLQRLISQPILALTDTARVVAERKDYSVRSTRQGRDEIGLLADAFNQMLAEIEAGQSALFKANQSLESQAQLLQEANQSLKAQTDRIMETVGILGSSATGMLDLSSHVATSATQTATAVSETTATVEQVRQTAMLSSQRTRQVSEGAQRVAEISQRGQASTQQTASDMNRIREQMESIAQSMLRLSEQTQAIGQIIASVDDLAQQSNLLAVNAAIEAAKAGEHGKGFAVVAHEVRNLAEQSRQATTQVRTILNDVQRSTNAAVMATEQGSKAVEAGVRQSQEAGVSIVSLTNSIAEAAQAAVQIAASSQQQLAGMGQVAQAMESIQQASTQNVASARQLESAAQDLMALGKRLKEMARQEHISREPSEAAAHLNPVELGVHVAGQDETVHQKLTGHGGTELPKDRLAVLQPPARSMDNGSRKL
jgi:methyl-accepting chemotaxis protein